MARAVRKVERVTFDRADPTAVVAAMERLVACGDGWINITPRLAGEDPPNTTLRFLTLFGGGAPDVTMATWVHRRDERRQTSRTTLGIAHRSGRRLLNQLVAAGRALPLGWEVEQDHPNRGLVVLIPPDAAHETVLAWAIDALVVVLGSQAIGGWRAEVHG